MRDAPFWSHTLRQVVTPVALLSLALSACTVGVGGDLSGLAGIQCPQVAPLVFVSSDQSATGRSSQLTNERLKIIEGVLTATAVCGGRARVELFSSSAAATQVVLDQELKPGGATRNARLRRVPKLIDTAMKQIEAEWNKAIAELPAGGSDVLAQLTLAQEYRLQAGSDRPLAVVILSDGVQTTGLILNTPDLTQAVASDLGNRVEVPNFGSIVHLTFAGLGKVAGPPPPTQFIDALKTFYAAVCRRTGARCTVATDFVGQGVW